MIMDFFDIFENLKNLKNFYESIIFYNVVKFWRQIKCIENNIERQRNKNNELFTYLSLEICIIKSNSSLRYNNLLHHLDIFD